MAEQFTLKQQFQRAYGELHADAVEMLAARAELAQLELRLSQRRAKRLAGAVGICLLMAATGYVVLMHLAVENMPNIATLDRPASLSLLGGTLLFAGLGLAWWAIRRFSRKYRHFEQSLAELQADARAISNWAHQGSTAE